jgi:hypothetical protein
MDFFSKQKNKQQNSHSRESTPEGISKTNINMYCAFKGKPRTYVLLATAIVHEQNSFGQYVPCRALLNSASESHFVMDRLVQRLKLAKLKKRTFIQGISDVNTEALHMVPLHIKSRYNNWHTTMDCVVLPNITGNTPATKLDISQWNLPKNLQLADETFNQPDSIDILIGADLFYEILLPGRSTRPGKYPVLQETVLGWTVAGKTPTATANQASCQALFSRDDINMDQQLQ